MQTCNRTNKSQLGFQKKRKIIVCCLFQNYYCYTYHLKFQISRTKVNNAISWVKMLIKLIYLGNLTNVGPWSAYCNDEQLSFTPHCRKGPRELSWVFTYSSLVRLESMGCLLYDNLCDRYNYFEWTKLGLLLLTFEI